MAIENSRKKIGSLFGGEVMTVNYNFQSGSESSTCTLTLISKNNEFIEPELNQRVSVPPFGLPMTVLSTSVRQDPQYKVLQVELIDSLSEILDRELVLIYGEHTDLDYKLNVDPYKLYKGLCLSKAVYPSALSFNNELKFPSLSKDTIKNYGDGINVIGFPRVRFKEKRAQNITGSDKLSPPDQWITFDAGEINQNLTDYDNSAFFVYSSEIAGSLELKFGYTIKNLKDLIISKGVSFDSESLRFLDDENVLFTETGTLRSTLTSALSKMGRSFYIDPFTQKIHIVTNADIVRINQALNEKYLSFENTEGAEQLNLTKSIQNVEATHFVAKGDLDDLTGTQGQDDQTQVEPRRKRQAFYKLDTSTLTAQLVTQDDLFLIKNIAPYQSIVQDDEATNRFAFGLGLLRNTNTWGSLYGEKEYDFKGTNNILSKEQGSWYEALNQSAENDFIGFDPNSANNAIFLRQRDGRQPARSVSDAGYLSFISDLVTLWGGVYFSAPMSEYQYRTRDYSNSTVNGANGSSFNIIIEDGEKYIAEVSELSFLQNILKEYKKKANEAGIATPNILNYKVKDIAEIAYSKARPVTAEAGEGTPISRKPRYYGIAINNLFFGEQTRGDIDLRDDIMENVYLFSNDRNQRFLPYSNQAPTKIKNISDICLASFNGYSEKIRDKIIINYIKVRNDGSSDDDGDDVTEIPELFYIENFPSKSQNFSKRNVSFFKGGYLETKLFVENINEINPQFDGPFITTDIKYYRPPEKSDFDIGSGVDSVSISVSNQGVSTAVKYSSKKFAQIDTSISTDLALKFFKTANQNAFTKNQQGN